MGGGGSVTHENLPVTEAFLESSYFKQEESRKHKLGIRAALNIQHTIPWFSSMHTCLNLWKEELTATDCTD